MSSRFCSAWIFGITGLLISNAVAHEMRPALLELEEKPDDQWAMVWKVPARGPDMRLSLDVRLPEGVEWVEMPSREYVGEAFVDRGLFQIPGGLDDREIYVEGLLSTFTDAMVQIRRLDGTLQNARLDPSDPSLVVVARPSPSEIPKFYFAEGWRYLQGAWDHFAFVIIIVLACRTNKSALRSVGCFLVAMAATALISSAEFLAASTRWTEIMVSLSLIPPALAAIRNDRAASIERFPAVFAALAGIFHGASLLSLYATAAPAERSSTALVAFLAAVLLGLLLPGAAAIGIKRLLQKDENSSSRLIRFRTLTAYSVGILAVAWTLQRW